MLKNLKDIIVSIIDFFLPERRDYSLIKTLNDDTALCLPKAPNVEGLDWAHPLFHYKNDRVRAIIWELKYRGVTLPLGFLGKMLYEEIISCVSEITLFDNDAEFILLPIPITIERRRERGFNQSEYIAKAILENDLDHILLYAPQWFQKIKETPKQSLSETKIERQENLKNCFEADPRLHGKYMILIDDVVTTGSTLLEARGTLIQSGAKGVIAFTVAH